MKTPVVLFLFKRHKTLYAIFEQIRKYQPNKLYLIGDGGRNLEEIILVEKSRKTAINLVDWDCEIITRFQDKNIGVYRNIGEGSKWVFEREKCAIFLEDDTLPEDTFFKYCDDLLQYYESDPKVIWLCGTNYLIDSSLNYDKSYFFTHHLLPCGWASWSSKFNKFYDGMLETLNKNSIKRAKSSYYDMRLMRQEIQLIKQTKIYINSHPELVSWDRQMCFSIRSNDLYGIAPVKNQIRNIGVDELSTHGGNSLDKEMTARFCELDTIPLDFPLKHPTETKIHLDFELETGRIIVYPIKERLKRVFARIYKFICGIDPNDSLAMRKKLNESK